MEEKKRRPSLPANYVTLAQLQQSWLQQQKQQQQQPPPHEQQHEDKIGLEQLQGESHQRHATASRSFAGKENPNNRNQQKNRDDSEGIDRDRDGDVSLEGEGSMQWKEKVKSKTKQARVEERGTKFEENEEKEKEEVKQGSRPEYFYQQHRHGAAVRVFARKQSHFNRANHWKVRGDSGTNAEKQRNEADTGIRGADAKSKGNYEPKKNKEAKPKPNVYEGGIKTEEKKEKEKQDEDEEVKQEQRRGTASRSFVGKHDRNGRLNRGKIRADFGTNAEKQCHDVGIGDGESKMNATKPKSLIVKKKTEMGGENGKKQREEVSNAEEEKAKIMESQSNEESAGGGGGVPMEEVEQRFRGLEFRRMGDGLNYAQPSSYGGSIYGYINRKGYRSGHGNDYGYGNRDFERGKRGEKMVWIRKVDNIGETEN
ncbi:hypothetical protein HN51_017518 [Arachis hypogaea]|nr:myb-like protein X [Arachis hypogaea]QHN88606.1 uncharacterized protein DS421_16g564890 [Arachis hypogaea]